MLKMRWFLLLFFVLQFHVFANMQSDVFNLKTKEKLEKIIEENAPLIDKNTQALKLTGAAWHQLAINKKSKASEYAVEYLSRYCQAEPGDMMALAWLGSSYAMLARDSGAVFKKITYTNKGLSMLDKAVNSASDSYQIRLLRASVAYSVPDMFSRKKTAFNDYLYLTSHFSLSPELMSEFYYKLGILADNSGDVSQANEFFKKSVSADEMSEWASKAKGRL